MDIEALLTLFGARSYEATALDLFKIRDGPPPLSLDASVAQALLEDGFDLFYLPPADVSGRGYSPDGLLRVWEHTYPDTALLFDAHDVHKWYTRDSQSPWYQSYRPGWVAIRRPVLEETVFSTYTQQTRTLAHFVSDRSWRIDRPPISDPIREDTVLLAHHSVNTEYRTSFAEELIRLMLVYHATGERILQNEYVWTRSFYAGNEAMRVGFFDTDGADVTKRDIYDGNSATALSVRVGLTRSRSQL